MSGSEMTTIVRLPVSPVSASAESERLSQYLVASRTSSEGIDMHSLTDRDIANMRRAELWAVMDSPAGDYTEDTLSRVWAELGRRIGL